MAAPHTPQVTVQIGFGAAPFATQVTWSDMAAYRPREVTVSRGRPSELDHMKPAALSLVLTDTTARDLDPTNLAGPHVESYATTDYATTGAAAVELGTPLGTNNAQTLPPGVLAGDLLLAFVTVDNPAATATVTGTGSATWATLYSHLSTLSDIRQTCFARIATGSDALVVTGAAEDYVCSIVRIVNHGCATTADVKVGTSAEGLTANADPPSLNAGATAKWLWIAAAGLNTSTGETISAVPAGFTELVRVKSAESASSCYQAVAWRQLEQQTLDPGVFTSSLNRWSANTLAVPPLSTGGTRTQITPGTPIRVVATLPSRAVVLDDPCAGPGLHTAWRSSRWLEGGTIPPLSGTIVLPAGAQLDGPAYNFDGDAVFQHGTVNDGATPSLFVRLRFAGGGHMGWQLIGPNLTYLVFDGTTTTSDTIAWSDVNHRYLRMRTTATSVVWERSADGSSWTTIDTYVRGVDIAATVDWSWVSPQIQSGDGDVTLDDFKIEVSRFTRFRGTVDAWDYRPLPANRGASVTVTGSDALKLLANTVLRSPWADLIDSHAPTAWWPLSEPPGSVVAHDQSGHGRHGIYPSDSAVLGVDQPAPLLGPGGIRFPARTTRPGVRLPATARITAAPFTWCAWVKADDAFPDAAAFPLNLAGMVIYKQASLAGDAKFFRVKVQARTDTIDSSDPSNPQIQNWVVGVYIIGAGTLVADYYANLEDGLPHLLTVTVDAALTPTVYIDGTEASTWQTYAGVAESFVGTYIGRDEQAPGTPNGSAFPGTIGQVAVLPAALSAVQVRELWDTGLVPWEGDSTGQRTNRVLDLVGWPSAWRRVDTGETTVGLPDIDGQSCLSYLQAVAETEGGALYVGAGGEIVFRDAARAGDTATDPVVFDDAGAGIGLLGDGFTVRQDDQFLFTAAQVSRPGGVAQVYSDPDATARFGTLAWSGQVISRLDSEARMRAIGVVGRYSQPAPRVDGFTVAPQKTPALWGDALSVDVTDIVSLSYQLLDTGTTTTSQVDIAQITETIADGAWTLNLAVTPRDPTIGTYFEWDATADLGWNAGKWR